jgi:hypothetical protein
MKEALERFAKQYEEIRQEAKNNGCTEGELDKAVLKMIGVSALAQNILANTENHKEMTLHQYQHCVNTIRCLMKGMS